MPKTTADTSYRDNIDGPIQDLYEEVAKLLPTSEQIMISLTDAQIINLATEILKAYNNTTPLYGSDVLNLIKIIKGNHV